MYHKTGKGSTSLEKETAIDIRLEGLARSKAVAIGRIAKDYCTARLSSEDEILPKAAAANLVYSACLISVQNLQINRYMEGALKGAAQRAAEAPDLPVFSQQDNIPEFLNDPASRHYWEKRYHLFAKYDEGVMMDEDSWHDVSFESGAVRTAETIKTFIAIEDKENKYKTCIDVCCGIGGFTIQLAKFLGSVTSLEINPAREEMLKKNLAVYDVPLESVDYKIVDMFEYCQELYEQQQFTGEPYTFNWALVDFPWGGRTYNFTNVFSMAQAPFDVFGAVVAASKVARNVAVHSPRKTDMSEIIALAQHCGFSYVEINKVYHEKTVNTRILQIYMFRDVSIAALRIKSPNIDFGKVPDRSKLFVTTSEAQSLIKSLVCPMLATRLGEKIDQKDTFHFIWQEIGTRALFDLFALAFEIQVSGGLKKTEDNSKRSLGGVFYRMLKKQYPEVSVAIDRQRKADKFAKSAKYRILQRETSTSA